MDKYNEALMNCNKSLEMFRKIYGNNDNPNIPILLNNIGEICLNNFEFVKALEYLNKSLEILKKIYETDDNLIILVV